jgi:hypothetical protein
LLVTEDEIAYLGTLSMLIGTPRAAKRLVNTYQLLRVSVNDVSAFLGSGSYRPLLLVLALVTGSRGISPEMRRSLHAAPPELKDATLLEVSMHITGMPEKSPDPDFMDALRSWQPLINELGPEVVGDITIGGLVDWIEPVSRFSFPPA